MLSPSTPDIARTKTIDCMDVCVYTAIMTKEPMTARQIRVDKKLWDEAKEIASKNDERISDVIRRGLENYVRRHAVRRALMQYVKDNQS